MSQKYEEAVLEIFTFDSEDVITTSGGNTDDDEWTN